MGEVHDPAGPQPDEPLEPIPMPAGPAEPPTRILPDPDPDSKPSGPERDPIEPEVPEPEESSSAAP